MGSFKNTDAQATALESLIELEFVESSPGDPSSSPSSITWESDTDACCRARPSLTGSETGSCLTD